MRSCVHAHNLLCAKSGQSFSYDLNILLHMSHVDILVLLEAPPCRLVVVVVIDVFVVVEVLVIKCRSFVLLFLVPPNPVHHRRYRE